MAIGFLIFRNVTRKFAILVSDEQFKKQQLPHAQARTMA